MNWTRIQRVKPDTVYTEQLESVRSKRNAAPFRSSEWKRLNVWQSIQLDFLYVERIYTVKSSTATSKVTSPSYRVTDFWNLNWMDTDSES